MNKDNFFKKNGFSIALCSSVAIGLVATLYFSYSSFTKNNADMENTEFVQLETEEETFFQPVDKSDVKSYKESTETTTIEATTQTTTEAPTETTTSNKTASIEEEEKIFSLFDESQDMSWPFSGNVVKNYDMETAVYDKTLDQYKVSDSICISAPVGTEVKASAEGIVENIFVDDENGQTVVINHGNGWLSTYGQLEENVSVAVGDIVKENDIIGKIASPSKYGIALGPHLDFKILKDNVSYDPNKLLVQLDEE